MNLIHLKRLVLILGALKKYVGEWKEEHVKAKEKIEIMTVAQLMEKLGRRVAGINFLEVETYLKQSKARLSGFEKRRRVC